jgi:hypothetical protein
MIRFLVPLICAVTVGHNAPADVLAQPTGEVVLTITGAIEHTNGNGAAMFDLEMLEEMEQREFTTATIWTDGPQVFTGVELVHILHLIGASGDSLRAHAINDYTVSIPVADAVSRGPIIAYRRNGEPMSRRDKGPLWIVYPYDSSVDYRSEVIYSRSIWSLERIEVTP